MVAAGLLAKKAVEKGLKVPPHVKTSLAPGSRVVTDYFDKAGLDQVSRRRRLLHGRLRLHDLHRQQRPAARADFAGDQGERSRGGRRALGQPQLRGPHQPRREGQLPRQPAAGGGLRPGRHDRHRLRRRSRSAPARTARRSTCATSGRSTSEVQAVVDQCVLPEMFTKQYDDVWDKNPKWNAIKTSEGELYEWDRGEHVHPGAAVPGRPHAGGRARSSRSTAPAAWRRWAIR